MKDSPEQFDRHRPPEIPGVVFDDSQAVSPPLELVKRLLPIDGIVFIGGQSGAGKTFVMIDLAIALASPHIDGRRPKFFDFAIRERVGVVILAAEGAGTLAHRIEVARRHRGIQGMLPLAYVRDVPNLSDPVTLDPFLEKFPTIETHFRDNFGVRLGVIFIDTVAAAFQMEDENNNSEAARSIEVMRAIGNRTKSLVMPIHHYGKSADTGLRGASAFKAGADVVISVLAERNEITGRCGNRSVALSKSRNRDEGPLSTFQLEFTALGTDEDGDSYGSCAVVASGPIDTSSPKRKETPSIVKFREACKRALASSGEAKPELTGVPERLAVRVAEVKNELSAASITADDDPAKRKERIRKAVARGIQDLSAEYRTRTADGIEWIWPIS